MSLRAINPDRLVPYVPDACYVTDESDPAGRRRPLDDAPCFLLRAIPAGEMAEIEDAILERIHFGGDHAARAGGVSVQTRQAQQKLRILRAGLRGWQRFRMPSTQDPKVLVDAPFEADAAGAPTDRTLSMLPRELRIELANAITEIQHVSEDAYGK